MLLLTFILKSQANERSSNTRKNFGGENRCNIWPLVTSSPCPKEKSYKQAFPQVYTGLLVEVPFKHHLCKICTRNPPSSLYRSSRRSLQTRWGKKKNVLQVHNLKIISVIQFWSLSMEKNSITKLSVFSKERIGHWLFHPHCLYVPCWNQDTSKSGSLDIKVY